MHNRPEKDFWIDSIVGLSMVGLMLGLVALAKHLWG
ncbi:hypothetical protein FDH66_gp51 [Arthrobacter phage Amigo]|uniref:Uncharacterized protein n=5 Tax=Amigovirus amigo TaxID=1982100 RepID=A0A5J6TDB6_9CAUD|nr:hypothetical protein FDH66_gp51 [Arthrobacter phage Amigo]QFG08384.1 hypothetical protein SEA_YEEZUS_52 [Arthrobacter phage Yeezus]QFG13394.1 hypothetical protein SEA_ICHOR_52 [Arthrobacter phage Ichor]QFG13912.1 hypothetical protein SEA_JAEK_52 [Arthrobacter phage Jaek]QJD51699.1 hypothetical protein SEA_BOERSMA_54 [Arthrobacter phage Boersma]ALY08449.1 hypothetical protein AMIGO_52 [Arthrobacter phage Amigo]